MSDHPITVVWFRQDLRLADNPALRAGAEAGRVLPIYILDDDNAGDWPTGAASRTWLHHSLTALDRSLDGRLRCFRGDAADIVDRLADALPVGSVLWNRCYEPWRIRRDKQIKTRLADRGVDTDSFNGSLLWEPWTVNKPDGSPYRVFTPFYEKGCRAAGSPQQPLAAPRGIDFYTGDVPQSLPLDALGLLPALDWHEPMLSHWEIGEAAASRRLDDFCEDGLADYRKGRDFPARRSVSRLSPHLHFGEISPRQAWHRVEHENLRGLGNNPAHFLRELAWREFSYYLLFHFPELPAENFNDRFDAFEWREDARALERWQRGQTGFPIVDAGMRELWQTGYMHNRVRMIVGSFLVKNLLLHWREGERWFWDCLVDADLASNSASWQWVAGSGADAAPYFRIFNPLLQSEKFDPDGEYIARFCPELAALPAKHRHQPWAADDKILRQAGIRLGEDYPRPMVDLKATRERALARFKALP